MEIASLIFLHVFNTFAYFFYILDYYMDGQLGVSGENSAVPCLLEQFVELASPDSVTDESETKSKAPPKV